MLNLLLFARLRELAGASHLQVSDLRLPLSLADVLVHLRQAHPALAPALEGGTPLRAALNQQMVGQDFSAVLVREGDELALFPPVTGG